MSRNHPARWRRLLHGDSVLVLIFLCLTIGYLYLSLQLRRGFMSDVVGPRNFPIILSVLGIGLAGLFFVTKLMPAPTADEGRERQGSVWEEHRTLVPLGLTLAYAMLLQPLGFPLATFLFTAILLKLLGQPGWTVTLVFALGLTAASFGLFSVLFDVRLPAGYILPRFY